MTARRTASAYRISDLLYLWLLTQPSRPVLIGELRLIQATRGVSLRYAQSWLAAGFPLSEDLPLIDREFLPAVKETAAGAVDDARPDRWGERVIRILDKPPRLSLLEYLYFAGDDRFGTLGVSTSSDIRNLRNCCAGRVSSSKIFISNRCTNSSAEWCSTS